MWLWVLYYSAFANNLTAYFYKMTFWIEAPSLYWKWHQKSRVLSRILTATVNIRDLWPQKAQNARKCSHAVKKLKIGSKNSSKSLKTIVQVNLWCKNNKKTITILWKYYYMIIFLRSAQIFEIRLHNLDISFFLDSNLLKTWTRDDPFPVVTPIMPVQ